MLLPLRFDLFARHLAASKAPILVGPWRSEVGFELLYWIPFLHSVLKRYGIGADRVVAIGRGGSAAWYGTGGTADLYEHLPVEVVRALSIQASQQTGSLKQNATPAWERHVCALTATSLGITRYHVLSPSWMYQLIAPFWEGKKPVGWLEGQLLQPMRMPTPPLPPQITLPKRFVAMRWYARPTWPLKEDLVLWTRQTVEAVAQRLPVVLIESGMHADDHADIALGDIPNVIRLRDLTEQTPLNNLAIQSAVIAKAAAYIGTYGGMAQGAMRWGVPTVALYHQFGQTSAAHLHLSQHLSLHTGVPFIAGTPGQLDQLLPLVLQSAETGQKMPHGHQPEPTGSSGVMENGGLA